MTELTTVNPLVDISPNTIEELFSNPPEDLTREIIEKHVYVMRELRGRREAVAASPKEKKEKVIRPKAEKPPVKEYIKAAPKVELMEDGEDPGF